MDDFKMWSARISTLGIGLYIALVLSFSNQGFVKSILKSDMEITKSLIWFN